MLKFLKGKTSIVMMGNIGAAAFNMFGFMILARMLSTEDFGIWALFLTLFVPTEMLRNGLCRNALIKMKNIDENSKVSIPRAALSILASVGLMTSLISLLMYFIGVEFNLYQQYQIILLGIAASTLAKIPQEFSMWNAQADRDFNYMSLSFLSISILNFLGICVAWFFFPYLEAIFYVHFISRMIPSIHAYAFRFKTFHRFVFVLKDIKKILNYGKFSLTTTVSSSFLNSVDSMLLASFIGPTAVAVYNVPLRWVNIINIPIRSANQTFFPRASSYANSNDIISLKRSLNHTSTIFTLISFAAVVFTMVFAEQMILIIAGKDYLHAANFLRFMVATAALGTVGNFLGVVMDSLNKPQVNAKMVTVSAVANAILDAVALLLYESIWSVLAVTIVLKIAGTVYLAFNVKRHTGWSLRNFLFEVFPFKTKSFANIAFRKIKTLSK